MTALTVRQYKVAAATYPLNWFDDWQAYEEKLTSWIEEAFNNGAKLAVFPEYGGQELASLCGDPQQAADPIASVDVITNLQRQVCGLHQHLADKFDMHILSSSAAIRLTNGQVVNRAYFYSPMRPLQWQDKQVMTRWERDDWIVQRGDEVDVFDTALGKIAVLICYDCEFPMLTRRLVEVGAELLLVPSATETEHGYHRVRIGAMARALESQCYAVHAPTTGNCFHEAVDINQGAAGIYVPPDASDPRLPANGILAMAEMNQPGWTYAEIDLDLVQKLRSEGHVLNVKHWPESL